MESDGPVAGLDVPTAKSPMAEGDSRSRTGFANRGLARGQDQSGRLGVSRSALARCLDGGDVDLLHRHHGLEGTVGLTATSRKRVG